VKAAYVYMLASKRNGTLYIGLTTQLESRIRAHKNKTIKGFTSYYDVHQLVYVERCETLEVAAKREKQLKKWKRKQKLELIERANPMWKDLYDSYL
jgi:putative endonuclease